MAELEISPLARLLAAYAGRDAERHRLLWALDARLADIIRTTSEPLIGQMRLTWWHEVLTDETVAKGRGDPLVDAWREAGPFPNESYLAMIDGWEELLGMETADEGALRTYAEGRGGGMIMAQTGAPIEAEPMLAAAGAVWALWDLSGHISDSATALRAIAIAKDYLPAASGGPWHRDWKASRLAFGIARKDVVKGQRAPGSLTPGLYARLLRIALVGR